MAFRSGVFIDLDFNVDAGVENRTTGELISMLKSSFHDADFARVESILVQREDKLKEELETTVHANDWLKEKLEDSGMEKHNAETELQKLKQLNSQLIEDNRIISERERKAESVIELWKKKYNELESRIRKLDSDIMFLASGELNSRVSSGNDNNVVEEKVNLAGANVDGTAEGLDSRRLPSGSIILISDSDNDDDCASEEILGRNEMTSQKEGSSVKATGKIDQINFDRNEMTSQRVANSYCSSQNGVQCTTGMLKRMHNSCPIVDENEDSNNGCVKDEDVDGNYFTDDRKVAKIQKSSHGHDGSSTNHCTEMAASSRTRVEKFCSPSSQQAVISRQYEEKTRTEHASQNRMKEFLLNLPGVCGIDCSSSSSSSSESDVDLDFDFPQLRRIINDKKWESESDMLASFEKENELYLKAVCALYRQQTAVGKSPRSSSTSNNPGFNQVHANRSYSNYRGFSQVNARRGTTLSEFLIDGDSQGKLKKSVSELMQYDTKGLDDCKKLAIDHSKQLFVIYQKKEDPLFMS